MNDFNSDSHVMSLPLSSIDDSYSCYRLIYPKAEKRMFESIERYGQLTPVVVTSPREGRCLLIDGFKRLRASLKLKLPALQATVLPGGERVLKAAMLHLNRNTHSMTLMEEAIIVRALYQEHRLSQVAIGTLLGVHKSWVCRRLAVVERLNEEVLEQVRLGLVGPTISRELGKLPHGNQSATLAAIRKHNMTCRETAELVTLLMQSLRSEIDSILYYPESILSQRELDKPLLNKRFQRVLKELSFIDKRCTKLAQQLQVKPLVFDFFQELSWLLEPIAGIEQAMMNFKKALLVQEVAQIDF
jgi:ParB/RepB/Spo0J family partition protein